MGTVETGDEIAARVVDSDDPLVRVLARKNDWPEHSPDQIVAYALIAVSGTVLAVTCPPGLATSLAQASAEASRGISI